MNYETFKRIGRRAGNAVTGLACLAVLSSALTMGRVEATFLSRGVKGPIYTLLTEEGPRDLSRTGFGAQLREQAQRAECRYLEERNLDPRDYCENLDSAKN